MTITQNKSLTNNLYVLKWIQEVSALCEPDEIYWCDGSVEEKTKLEKKAIAQEVITPLDQDKYTGCFYSRSNSNDVARVEHLTFICTHQEDDCGPTNHWMEPKEAYAKAAAIIKGSMKGRTLYVIPFVMGPLGAPGSKVGIQLSDSIYVALNMRIMTRMGQAALDQLGDSNDFTRCVHGMAELDPEKRLILHFPEDNAIWSVGSAYGGNALLGKKCLALRIGSYLGKQQGWMAEHMLILGIKTPAGKQHYICAAFPSQCGKTNLAMLIPPDSMPGYEVTTVGDDIAWLHVRPDGRLWAINPEAGFFGVAPGTSQKTNPVALECTHKDTIFTNVALLPDKTVWWEGLSKTPPPNAIDWQGKPWTPESKGKAAHPNSRFTSPAGQCSTISPEWENPQGVPISAILFGGRRATVEPLVYETPNWEHGAYCGATMASETTAAATGKVGVVRRDPFAMLPFIGYHVGDYMQHWLDMGKKIPNPPKIFHVNWFRQNHDGGIMWPGLGENLRVIDWILQRVEGKVEGAETPVGLVPYPEDVNLKGLHLTADCIQQLLTIDKKEWLEELNDRDKLFEKIGPKLPQAMRDIQQSLRDHFEE